MTVHASAGKHGVTREDAVVAAEHPMLVNDLDNDDRQRQIRLGFDPRGPAA